MNWNNTSGISNISIKHFKQKNKDYSYVIYQWYDTDGCHRSKNFSIKKLGIDVAILKAKQYKDINDFNNYYINYLI